MSDGLIVYACAWALFFIGYFTGRSSMKPPKRTTIATPLAAEGVTPSTEYALVVLDSYDKGKDFQQVDARAREYARELFRGREVAVARVVRSYQAAQDQPRPALTDSDLTVAAFTPDALSIQQ